MDLLPVIFLLLFTLITESLGATCKNTLSLSFDSYRYCPNGCCQHTGYGGCCSSYYTSYSYSRSYNYSAGLATNIIWIIVCSVGAVVTVVIVIVVICCCRRRRATTGTVVQSNPMQSMTVSTSNVQTSYMQPGIAYPQGSSGALYPQGQASGGYPQPQQSYPYQANVGYPPQANPGYPQQPQPQQLESKPNNYPTHPTALSDDSMSQAPPAYESLGAHSGPYGN